MSTSAQAPARGREVDLFGFLARFAPLIFLLVLMAVFAVVEPRFLKPLNLFNVMRQVSIYGLLAIGMTFVILTRGIDLSVGSVVPLAFRFPPARHSCCCGNPISGFHQAYCRRGRRLSSCPARVPPAADPGRRCSGRICSGSDSSCNSPGDNPRRGGTSPASLICVTTGRSNLPSSSSLPFDCERRPLLRLVVDEDRRAVLVAAVAELAARVQEVDIAPVDVEELLVADDFRVVAELHRLRVAGPAGRDLLIGGVRVGAADVARDGLDHPGHLLEVRLGAPEAAAGEGRDRGLARSTRWRLLRQGRHDGQAGEQSGHAQARDHDTLPCAGVNVIATPFMQ